MKIRPTSKYLIAVPYEEPKKVSLLMVEKKSNSVFVVKSIEDGSTFRVGQRILTMRFEALEETIDGETFYIIPIASVVAVIES